LSTDINALEETGISVFTAKEHPFEKKSVIDIWSCLPMWLNLYDSGSQPFTTCVPLGSLFRYIVPFILAECL